MASQTLITADEREEIETLIRSFDNHGCGFGYDLQAQAALRKLLNALDEAERTIRELESRV